MGEEKKDKFKEIYKTLAGELKSIMPAEYKYKGNTIKLSDKVRNVAADMFATEFAEYERIDDAQRQLDVTKKGIKGEKGLANYFKEVSKGLGIKIDYSNASDEEVVNYIRTLTRQHGYSASKSVESFIEEGDPTILNSLPSMVANEIRQHVRIKAKGKMDALKDKDGEINPDYKIQLSAANAAMQAMSGLYTIKPDPYKNIAEPHTTLDAMVQGMRSADGGGAYHNAEWGERLANKYAN
jgi:hypothetical protein